jgi:hypothetical protein
MNQTQLIKFLHTFAKRHQKRVFRLREFVSLSRESPAAVAMSLIRAERSEILFRIANFWVNRWDPPSLVELALALEFPSYVSFESALYFRGILSQEPQGFLTVAVRARPRTIRTPLGQIQLIHLKASLFFGYDATRMALPEKALLDLCYIRNKKGIDPLFTETIYWNLLGVRRRRALERAFPKSMVKKLAEISTSN